MVGPLRKSVNSPSVVLFVLITIVASYGGGQEIVAHFLPHDDYYFLMRSESFGLKGSYLAPIKESLYPLFIQIPRLYGLSLRLFEVLSYAVACFFLWCQIVRLSQSRIIGWLTILPLALLPYQHIVFNVVTYDALQLILTPLTFASAIQLFLDRGSRASLLSAGVIAGLQMLTRPEGFLFILPPLVSLVALGARSLKQAGFRHEVVCVMKRGAIIILVPFALQQVVSAVNQYRFGFWAPTIMKSASYQASLAALMSVQPAEPDEDRYAPVPKSALMRAYEVSPELRKAKVFFDRHMDGKGWSSHALPGYQARDGSISGGHFQWAWLDAGAFVAGTEHRSMLAYFDAVARELDEAFRAGELRKRRVLSTAVGPNFSIWNAHFWTSLRKVGGIALNLGEPLLPELFSSSSAPEVEEDFNRLALRRVALLQSERWSLSGWALNPGLGVPKDIALDDEARDAGITISVLSRPDVVQAVLKSDDTTVINTRCGFRLSSPGPWSGHLMIEYEDGKTAVPIVELKTALSGASIGRDGIHLQVDSMKRGKSLSERTQFRVIRWLSATTHSIMKVAVLVLIPLLAVLLISRVRLIFSDSSRTALWLILALALSVALPRLGLLAAIDSVMYPGAEPRYLAAAAFSVWMFVAFTTALFWNHVVRYLFTRLDAKWMTRDIKMKGPF